MCVRNLILQIFKPFRPALSFSKQKTGRDFLRAEKAVGERVPGPRPFQSSLPRCCVPRRQPVPVPVPCPQGPRGVQMQLVKRAWHGVGRPQRSSLLPGQVGERRQTLHGRLALFSRRTEADACSCLSPGPSGPRR